MKLKKLSALFVLPLVMGLILIEELPKPEETPIALVKKIVKDVTYKKANQSDWEIAKTGTPLKDGEEVKTGSKSLALILFTDGSGLMRVRENSILHIYGAKEGKKINKNTYVDRGLVGFEVNKQGDEEFKFTTPTAVASIRGTNGFLDVYEDSTTKIFLESGEVEFESLIGERRTGRVLGGSTAIIDSDGNIVVEESSEDDKTTNRQTRTLTTRKVEIKTNKGNVTIEYYSSER